jgi:hypothetical protein
MSSIAGKRSRGLRVRPSVAARAASHFTADITGDVQAAIGGDAVFSELQASDGASPTFSLLLGPLSAQGAVLLSWTSKSRPSRGIYPIAGWEEQTGHFRALVVLGPVERPLAELQASRGALKIISASNTRLIGSFTFVAVARQLSRAPLRVALTGSFTARAS